MIDLPHRPGPRRKLAQELEEEFLAGSHDDPATGLKATPAEIAARRLLALVHEETDKQIAFRAAKEILDRAWGRPVARHDVHVRDAGFLTQVLDGWDLSAPARDASAAEDAADDHRDSA